MMDIIERTKILREIKALKQKLAETDYKTLKYVEGAYTAEEFEPYKQERQLMRIRIRELESELSNGDK